MDLKQYREEVLDINREELAEQVDMTRQSIYNLEESETGDFTWETVRKLRNNLNLPRSVVIDLLVASLHGTKNDVTETQLRQGWMPDGE